MSRISAAISSLEGSETAATTERAARLRARGVDVISFGAGQPDFPTPTWVVEAAAEACRDPGSHRYTDTAGHPELRAAIAASIHRGQRRYGSEGVLVTNGAKQAVLNALTVLLGPGDEALLPTPYWVTYPAAVRLAGGTPVPVPSVAADGFKVSPVMLDEARTRRTRVLIFNSPCNPTGTVYTKEECEAIADWAEETGVWLVCDEIYENFVYPPATFASPASSNVERVVVVGGVSKTYAMTGWRVGWLLGPVDVITAATNVQSHTTYHVNNVAQSAALAALSGDQGFVEEVRASFDLRRRRIVSLLEQLPGFALQEPIGAFYAFPDVRGLVGRELAGARIDSSQALADALLDQTGVAVVAGEGFGAPGFVRFSYALDEKDLLRGMERLAHLLGGLA